MGGTFYATAAALRMAFLQKMCQAGLLAVVDSDSQLSAAVERLLRRPTFPVFPGLDGGLVLHLFGGFFCHAVHRISDGVFRKVTVFIQRIHNCGGKVTNRGFSTHDRFTRSPVIFKR